MISFFKSRESDLDKIEELLQDAESQLRRDFLSRINAFYDDEKIERIRVFLEQGRIDLALDELEEDNSSFLLLLFNTWVLASTLQIALVKTAIQNLQAKLLNRQTPFGFDPTDPDNARLIKEIQLRISQNLDETKRNNFLTTVNEGLRDGLSPKEITQRLYKFRGLTVNQINAVLNYERLLRQGSKQALDRALRDKNLDGRVASDKPLTENQINRLVDAYIRNQRNYRAEVIGRTIAGDLINEAFQNAAKKALADVGLPTSYLAKTWRSMRDKKVRRTHQQHVGLDGQTVGIDEYFISPSGARLKHPRDGSAPISEIAGCRCWLLVSIIESLA